MVADPVSVFAKTRPRMIPPINGLLLVGGRSRRMGCDKAELAVRGSESLRDRGLRLLRGVAEDVHLSIAADDQRSYSVPTLADRVADQGPLGGILTALESTPGKAWLVMACDLPNVDEETLAHLVAARDPESDVTCFRSEIDGVAEPLCAIYEPSALDPLRADVEAGRLCARRFLDGLTVCSLLSPTSGSLQNCNRPEDVEELRRRDVEGGAEKSVTVEFFAKLRDEAGYGQKEHTTRAATAAGLWDEMRVLHGLSMDLETVRVAINDEFADWRQPLKDGDRVAFMPPFAGG
jgi:molybdopterin-guanine dinucleotide biosynthesis protein A